MESSKMKVEHTWCIEECTDVENLMASEDEIPDESKHWPSAKIFILNNEVSMSTTVKVSPQSC
jgi:hypothetical protein